MGRRLLPTYVFAVFFLLYDKIATLSDLCWPRMAAATLPQEFLAESTCPSAQKVTYLMDCQVARVVKIQKNKLNGGPLSIKEAHPHSGVGLGRSASRPLVVQNGLSRSFIRSRCF
jgi:hypothetical protein